MPDKYRRPSPASPPLRFVGGGPPIVTPEHAYEMSKDAGDLNIDRSISIPVVGNIGPRTQTGITSGLNILGAVQEYREALAEIKDLQRSLEIRSIGNQIQEQLQPGQAVQVVVSEDSNGHIGVVEITQPNRWVLMSKESEETGAVKVFTVEKPGPGDLQCTIPKDSTPPTTVFHIKEADRDTTIRKDTDRETEQRSPTPASKPSAPAPQTNRSDEKRDRAADHIQRPIDLRLP